MTKKDSAHTPAASKRHVQSAPELPHEVAKQFGLHHDAVPDHTSSSKEQPSAASSQESKALIDDAKTDAAVDDILTKEGDELLGIRPDTPAASAAPKKRGFWAKLGHFFVRWWRNPWARWITIALLVLALAAVSIIPKTRYAALNMLGVRSSASVVVLDNTTQLPLKNVSVTIGDHEVRTDVAGVANFRKLKLGSYNLDVKRIAFAPQSRSIIIGWGSNPLGTFELQATGVQYTVTVTDTLSNKPIERAEVTSQEVNAVSDKNGKAILTVEDTEATTLAVEVLAAGYRTEAVTLNANENNTPIGVKLLPAGKAVYVSKQSGKYDVIASDLDGNNKKTLLTGTGSEGSTISLGTSQNGERAALVSTRDTARDSDGFLLSTLTIIDVATGTAHAVDRAQQIQLIDWIGGRLIYRITVADTSAANPQRSRLMSYDVATNARTQLATANQFTAATSIKGTVYYAVSSSDPKATMGLFRIKPDGSGRRKLSDNEVWTAFRTAYQTLSLQTPQGWYALDIATEKVTKADAPGSVTSYAFRNDSTGQHSIWNDTRDGKGTLLLYDIAKATNTVIAAHDGLTTPVRWVGDHAIIYRVVTSGESADYVVSPTGGQSYKLADVTATQGLSY